MRHFPHHIGDYAAATAHLSFVEDAAYHRCLRRYYQDEKPLPVDPADVQRLVGARTRDEKSAVRVVLQEFFTLQDDGWHQTRADEEIAAYLSRVETARENGRKSGGRPKPRYNRPGYPRDTPSVSHGYQSNQLTSNQGKAPTGLFPEEHQTSVPVAAREPLEGSAHDASQAISTLASRLKIQ